MKKHEIYRDEKKTIITRLKVIQPMDADSFSTHIATPVVTAADKPKKAKKVIQEQDGKKIKITKKEDRDELIYQEQTEEDRLHESTQHAEPSPEGDSEEDANLYTHSM